MKILSTRMVRSPYVVRRGFPLKSLCFSAKWEEKWINRISRGGHFLFGLVFNLRKHWKWKKMGDRKFFTHTQNHSAYEEQTFKQCDDRFSLSSHHSIDSPCDFDGGRHSIHIVSPHSDNVEVSEEQKQNCSRWKFLERKTINWQTNDISLFVCFFHAIMKCWHQSSSNSKCVLLYVWCVSNAHETWKMSEQERKRNTYTTHTQGVA